MNYDYAIIIRSKTRLEVLNERFNTNQQVQFYLERNNVNYDAYQEEHDNFYRALDKLCLVLSNRIKYKVIDRSFISSFIFSPKHLIIAIGQDGLVANTAKYANGQPIIGVNPDPSRYDGILLPYNKDTVHQALDNALSTKASTINVTMAAAKFSDGQELLAFNDFFIGAATHTSARYKIQFNQQMEQHSSSGIIVSTGAGSTGWLSSLYNMQRGLNDLMGMGKKKARKPQSNQLDWDAEELVFIVREPFLSRASGIDIISGRINAVNALELESMMPNNGVVFSDGIEKDFIRFNSGTSVSIGVSDKKAAIVMEPSMIAARQPSDDKFSKMPVNIRSKFKSFK